MIVVAIITCDRKAYSLNDSFRAAAELIGDTRLYVNIEVNMLDGLYINQKYENFWAIRKSLNKQVDYDVWSQQTSWLRQSEYDQDQVARLPKIVTARNMARSYFLNQRDATHILFVDSDVIVRPDGLKRLIAVDRPIAGGVVPGRGVHKHLKYIFQPVGVNGRIVQCRWSTLGYMLVRRDVMSQLAFRFGESRVTTGEGLSEDPAFCTDAALNGFGNVFIDTECIAEHWDNLSNPLTHDGVSKDQEIPY